MSVSPLTLRSPGTSAVPLCSAVPLPVQAARNYAAHSPVPFPSCLLLQPPALSPHGQAPFPLMHTCMYVLGKRLFCLLQQPCSGNLSQSAKLDSSCCSHPEHTGLLSAALPVHPPQAVLISLRNSRQTLLLAVCLKKEAPIPQAISSAWMRCAPPGGLFQLISLTSVNVAWTSQSLRLDWHNPVLGRPQLLPGPFG